jgi:sirohydrochlorin cobaltochelatase
MLILIAHGSRDPRWRASVEELIEPLQADLGPDAVRVAYMACTPPTLMDVAADAVRAGVKRIRVLPLFLAAEGHVIRDIHPLVDRLRTAHAQLEVDLLPPIGRHRLFQDMLRTIAEQSSG